MRFLLIALVLTVAAAAPMRGANAASVAHEAPAPAVSAQEDGAASSGNDDTVAIQLSVLGAVLATVFVVGTGAYLLRRRLGLTAYTPPKDSGQH
ncbi:MAG: hypothetical protein HY873_00605 [Chloroflexi bacterium]|nr:hypothetical protein [Chloroflexota bacterium]